MRNGKAQDIASDDIDLINIAERAFLFFRRYRIALIIATVGRIRVRAASGIIPPEKFTNQDLFCTLHF
jgi:hypothetical protein